MSWKTPLLSVVNSWLERRDRLIVRKSIMARFGVTDGPWASRGRSSSLPDGAAAYLRSDNPRLTELVQRYRSLDRPEVRPSLWTDEYVNGDVDLCSFRGDGAFVWQERDENAPIHYLTTLAYVHDIDKLSLLRMLGEDGLFGASTLSLVSGLTISRDLLDSIVEINFLDEALGLSTRPEFSVLDIGAGYGRLAHRLVSAYAGAATVFCADGVAMSTFLCEYYLRYRGVAERAVAVPLDDLEMVLKDRAILLATNIHSFSECSLEAITGWLDVLSTHRVSYLFVVPNAGADGGTKLLSLEPDHSHRDFLQAIEACGYRLVTRQQKYREPLLQRYGVSPTYYYLFRLE